MSYEVNKVAKFELENFKCVVEILSVLLIFGPYCLIRSVSSIARSCLLCSVASIVTFGSIWDPVMLLLWICW